MYVRYRDDILALSTHPQHMATFFGELRAAAKPFRLTVDAVARKSLKFLDLEISIVGGLQRNNSRRPDVHAVVKDSRNVPLSEYSGHPPSAN